MGESGYNVGSDGSVEYWAVRDALSVFAVGAMADEDAVDPGPDPIADEDAVHPRPGPRFCGLGMIQMLLPALAFLTMVKTMRRRFRK